MCAPRARAMRANSEPITATDEGGVSGGIGTRRPSGIRNMNKIRPLEIVLGNYFAVCNKILKRERRGILGSLSRFVCCRLFLSVHFGLIHVSLCFPFSRL